MKKSILSILFVLVVLHDVNGANPVSINFMPYYKNHSIKLEEKYQIKDTDSIRFDVLRFYISSISLYKNDSCVYKEPNSYHLVDASKVFSMLILMYVPEGVSFDRIKFNLGIDSTTNNAGVMGGDLDPTMGMYWTWQSGYINFKLEGVSSLCPSQNHEFQFHLGGYSSPNNSLREITFITGDRDIIINIDLNKFIDSAKLSQRSHIMSPGNEAMELSTLAASCFKLNQP